MNKEPDKNVDERALMRDTSSRGREDNGTRSANRGRMPTRPKYPMNLKVRCTSNEHTQLSGRAKDAGMSLSRYLIEAALWDGEAPDYETQMDQEKAIVLLARAGAKLNQVAKRLNAQREPINFRSLEESIAQTSIALDKLLRAYGRRT